MTTAIENIKNLASKFLNLADELEEKVSAYMDGSNEEDDIKAYNMVKSANKRFIDAVNSYYGSDYECGLDYELAESFID